MPKLSTLLRKFQFTIAVITGIAALALLIAFASREFTYFLDGLPWQNAAETTATVQNVVTIASPGSRNVSFNQRGPKDTLLISYQYPIGAKSLTAQMKMLGEEFHTAEEGNSPTSFALYYQPGNPSRHVAFRDPRPRFWTAAQRLAVAAVLAVAGLVFTVVMLRSYGRSQQIKRPAPEGGKLNWPAE